MEIDQHEILKRGTLKWFQESYISSLAMTLAN